MAHKSPARRGRSTSLERLAPFEDDCVLVVIETPKGSPNKLTFEPRYGTFVLKGVLPAGAVFPFDFGFVPSTRADDGDPLDVLVLMEAPGIPDASSLRVSSASSKLSRAKKERPSAMIGCSPSRPTPRHTGRSPAERSQPGPRRANRTFFHLVQRDEGQTFHSDTARCRDRTQRRAESP